MIRASISESVSRVTAGAEVVVGSGADVAVDSGAEVTVGSGAEVAVGSGGVVAVGVGVGAELHAATTIKTVRPISKEKVIIFIVFDLSF